MSTTSLRWPPKDPADVLDYSIDWTEQLALPATPDSIATVAWTVPAGLTKGADSHAGGVATVWLSGGVAGTDYAVTCRIVTAGGRTIERSAKLQVKEL